MAVVHDIKVPSLEGEKKHNEGETRDGEHIEKEWLSNQSFPAASHVASSLLPKQEIENLAAQEETRNSGENLISSEDERDTSPGNSKSKKRKYPSSGHTEADDRGKGRHKKKKKEKCKSHKHRSKHKKERHKKHNNENPIPVGTPKGKVFIEDMDHLKPEAALRFDSKPDGSNWDYHALYKINIARYRRFGNGCLGQGRYRMFFNDNTTRNKQREKTDSRYWQTYNLGNKSELKTDSLVRSRYRECMFDNKESEETGFIPIKYETTTEVTPNVSVNPLGVYDLATECYLQGKASVAQENQMFPVTGNDQDLGGYPDEHLSQKSRAQYNEYLRKNPHDIKIWIEFVEFQKEDVDLGMRGMFEDTDVAKDGKKSKLMALLDIQSAVLEKALEKNPASVELKMKQLEICNDLWEPERLDKEWEKLAFTHPNNPKVWWSRLHFLQSTMCVFSVGKLMKTYGKCISTLASILDGSFRSHRAPPHLEENIIFIYHQLIRVLAQTDSLEKATALLQANIELNLFCPSLLQTASMNDQLVFLERFWDSSMPRSGEVGALGFATWIEKKHGVPFCAMYNKGDEIKAENKALHVESRSQGWLSLEKSRSSRHMFPWRPDSQAGETEEDCEDLDRIVMLDDIKTCVFNVRSQSGKLRLVQVYLDFLGISIGQRYLSTDGMRSKVLRTALVNLSQISPLETLENHLRSPPAELQYQTALNILMQISTANVFTGFLETSVNLALLDVRRQYLRYKQQQNVDEKQWKQLCKEAQKCAKNLLKAEENRNELLLWEQYIFLEAFLGNTADVRRIFNTALNLSPNLNEITEIYKKCTTCKLYRSYAEMELGLHTSLKDLPLGTWKGAYNPENVSLAMYVLTSLPQIRGKFQPADPGAVPPPNSIVGARYFYQLGLENLMMQLGKKTTKDYGGTLRLLPQSGALTAHWTVCYALFEYVSLGIDSAVTVFDKVIDRVLSLINESVKCKEAQTMGDEYLEDGDVYYRTVYEDLILTKLRLIERHVSSSLVPLNTLRTPLQQSLQLLPDSPDLLYQFIQLEKRTNIVGRLRRQLLKISSASHTPLVWIYGAVAELRRHENLATKDLSHQMTCLPEWMLVSPVMPVGSRHQLRAWLEKGVSHCYSRYSILLWRLFFCFEISEGNLLGAKAIYYRAINQCPTAKALCMDFIRAFPDRLEEVTDYMIEKELRNRTPLEELDILLPEFKPEAPLKEEEVELDDL